MKPPVMPPWSHSGLKQFEACPRQYRLMRVTKQVKERRSAELEYGSMVHEQMESYARDGSPILATLPAAWTAYVDAMMALPGEKLVEDRVALDRDLRPCGYFDQGVWLRGIFDLAVADHEGKRAWIIDWKTGKRRPGDDQLRLFALVAFARWPGIDRVVAGFAWLQSGKFDRAEYHRSDARQMWSELEPRVLALADAHDADDWQPRRSGLCKGWCPVPRDLCEHKR